MYQSAQRIITALEDTDIPYALVKGIVLSDLAYGDAYLRNSRDIDLLLEPSSHQAVHDALLSVGCKQGILQNGIIKPLPRDRRMFYLAHTHQLPPYFYPVAYEMRYIEIDINFQMMWSQSTETINISDILNCTYDYCKDGLQIKTLQPVYFLIATCLHHYKDMNSPYLLHRKKRISFRRYCDIYYFIKNNSIQCSPKALTLIGRQLSVLPYLFYCIYECYTLFADKRLIPYIDELDCKEGRALTDIFGLSDSERQKWQIKLQDRIFTNSLKPYLENVLSKEVMDMIQINYKYL